MKKGMRGLILTGILVISITAFLNISFFVKDSSHEVWVVHAATVAGPPVAQSDQKFPRKKSSHSCKWRTPGSWRIR
jgi:hypothetical protein